MGEQEIDGRMPERNVTPADGNTIVVGHDGSAFAAGALNAALELAAALNKSVLVIRCWSVDTLPRGFLMKDGYVASFAEINDAITAELLKDTASVVERYKEVQVEYRAVLGQPADVLRTVSARARMLIVGSRGRGGFASLMLGSVSEQCVRHASCPVLVIRDVAGS